MQQEVEVMFGDVDKAQMRETLRAAGAQCVRGEYLQRRRVFDLVKPDVNKWIRVRDEGERTTLAYKEAGTKMEEQKELEFTVDDYDGACMFLEAIGCSARGEQETKRELWELDGAEVTIDTWPHLAPLVEIEGESEEQVQLVAEKLGFAYSDGIFGTVNLLYKERYGRFIEDLPSEKQTMTFDSPNPFVER